MDTQLGFVVMPFGTHSLRSAVYDKCIEPIVTGLGFDCVRVDKIHTDSRITDSILDGIRRAYFVIADLSEERPNCYYEVGFAHALRKPVIPIIEDGHTIHFDVKDLQFIVYKDTVKLGDRIRDRLIGAVLTTQGSSNKADPRRGKFGRKAIVNGRLLTATVVPKNRRDCVVRLYVRSLPGHPPLEERVRFYIHPTVYADSEYYIKVQNGEAVSEIEVSRAFTVGAKADNGGTILELDLATIPGGLPSFYGNQL